LSHESTFGAPANEGTTHGHGDLAAAAASPLNLEAARYPFVFQTELAAVGKVLGLIECQLADVNQEVEASVGIVCSGFQGMAQRAQAAVNAAQLVAADESQSTDSENLISKMRRVLESLLANVLSSSQFSQYATDKLIQLEQRLKYVEKIVRDVEKISSKAKMVAMNGRIEAARLGDAGKAFGVVAQETKELASNASETSLSIRKSITELATELSETTAEMQNRSSSDNLRFQESNLVSRQLLSDLDLSHRRMISAIETTTSLSLELRTDIAKSVMAMQFQDRVSQRVAHITETLSDLAARIDPWCAGVQESQTQQCYERWLREMESRYTMESERGTASPTGPSLSKSPPTAGSLADFSAELF
jgi:methyl-accepting chemotaxis protein